MPGTATYTQPISRTMKHNVNVIVNDNKTTEDNTALKPQNKNTDIDLMADEWAKEANSVNVSATSQVEQKEEDVLYDDIDKNQSSGLKVTWRPWTAIYDIEIFFHGRHRADQTEFAFEPHQVSKIVIEEEFVENFADHISIVLTLTPNEMLLLLDNYRELRCHIFIRRIHPDTEYIDKENPVLDQDYMVILKDKELRKRISKQSLMPNNNLEKNDEHHNQQFTNVELQLLTDKEYELKNKRFHFVLTDATVKDAICYGVKQLGIDKISMPEPENKTKYVNMIVPPQQSFKAFIDFLQDRYGVYNEGCNFYYSNEIMFIYPQYKRTVTDCPETAHFYCTGDGSFSGMKFYHAKDQNNMYHIVINHTPVIKEMIDAGAENFGNWIMFEHAEYMIDKHSVIGEGEGVPKARMGLGKIEVTKAKTTTFTWDGGENKEPEPDYGIINDPKIQEFIFTNNQMKYKSKLKSYRGTICGFEWGTAEPYFLRPGYAVKWHIDGERDDYYNNKQGEIKGEAVDVDNGGSVGEHHGEEETRDTMEYKTYDGIARAVVYKLMPAATPKATRYPFSCSANIVLDLDYLQAKKMDEPADIITNKYTDVALQKNSGFKTDGEKFDASSGSSSSSGSISPKYTPLSSSEKVNIDDSDLSWFKQHSTVYLLSYQKVTDGMRLKYELKWSDGTVTYIDTDEEIPRFKPTDNPNQSSNLFDLK